MKFTGSIYENEQNKKREASMQQTLPNIPPANPK